MDAVEPYPDARPILVYGPWSLRYDLGPGHPLTPRRFGPGIELLTAVAGDQPRTIEPGPAPDSDLQLVHDPAYIRVVRRFSEAPFGPPEAGIGPGDTPSFAGMHDASAAIAGGSLRGVEAILDGRATHVFHPGGGLHHAMRRRAAGFCVYDDPALAIARARSAGLRVLYLDFDVHHGDGVQAVHADDPGVLTLSIHQSGRTLFPGTGFIDELGEGTAAGTVVNVPLDPATGEDGWLAAIRRLVPEVAAAFGPDILITQHGADTHAWDPLANLRVTTTAMGAGARLADALAHRWAGGRWLSTGGGGYDAYRVVPRAWSLVWLAALHREHDLPTPEPWRRRWATEAAGYGQAPLPDALEDEPNAGIRVDGGQQAADARAIEIAGTVRTLVVPAIVRVAVDLGWWDPMAGVRAPGIPSGVPTGDGAVPTIIDAVDRETWDRLSCAEGVTAVRDAPSAHAIVAGALAGGHDVRVSAAVVDGRVVGLALSARPDPRGPRVLLSVGTAASHRRVGLATAVLSRHLEVGVGPVHDDGSGPWIAEVTVAERDPMDPLPRTTRAGVARRMLGAAGFRVERPSGPIGAADPGAVVALRT